MLNPSERKTLETIADPARGVAAVPRVHLEKLARLDLIAPGLERMEITLSGQKILFGRE